MPVPSSAVQRRRLALVSAAAMGVLSALAVGGTAYAYWGGLGTGAATADTASLNPATAVVAASTLNSEPSPLTWTARTLSTGQPATGYVIVRTDMSDGSTFAACGSSLASPVLTTSCSDLLVPDETYTYTVTAVVGSWTAAAADEQLGHGNRATQSCRRLAPRLRHRMATDITTRPRSS